MGMKEMEDKVEQTIKTYSNLLATQPHVVGCNLDYWFCFGVVFWHVQRKVDMLIRIVYI